MCQVRFRKEKVDTKRVEEVELTIVIVTRLK